MFIVNTHGPHLLPPTLGFPYISREREGMAGRLARRPKATTSTLLDTNPIDTWGIQIRPPLSLIRHSHGPGRLPTLPHLPYI